MPLLKIKNIGSQGLIKDIPDHELPPEAWSDGGNVRFREGAVQKFLGHSEVYATPSVAPYWALPVQTAITYYWLYAGLAKIYVTEGTSHYNITRQTAAVDVDYTGSPLDKWNGGIINGIPVINNGVDSPQMWNPVATSQRLAELAAWPASTVTACIRPFKGYLVALDVTKSSVRYPHMVKWSHQADAGQVPDSWDETDTTKDAGETSLSETPGYVIDCGPLKDTNIIYKEDSTWGMQYVGGQFIFRFYQIFRSSGILARDCWAAFEGKHIVLTAGDLIVHDGYSSQSIIDNRMKIWLFTNMDPTYYAQSFIAPNYKRNEMWVCFPSQGATTPDTALIWNWRENTLGVRDLPNVTHIAPGIVDPAEGLTWASDADTWADDTTTWDQRAYNPSDPRMLMVSPTNTKLYLADETDQIDGANMTAYIERTGLTFDDMEMIKLVKAVWPRISATNGTVVNVYVGYQSEIGAPVSYSGPFPFTVGTDRKIDCFVTGRLIALRFETTSNSAWKLNGYDIDVEEVGRY